jgi:hypothetical protein
VQYRVWRAIALPRFIAAVTPGSPEAGGLGEQLDAQCAVQAHARDFVIAHSHGGDVALYGSGARDSPPAWLVWSV